MSETETHLKTKSSKKTHGTSSQFREKLTAEQLRNRRELGEYGAKLIRDHKEEFIDLDDL
jgi:methylthioribose-1-phosphate isomerase